MYRKYIFIIISLQKNYSSRYTNPLSKTSKRRLPVLTLVASLEREDRVFGQNYLSPLLTSILLSSLIFLWLRIEAVHAELDGIFG
jgi:hypothetical protein